VTLCSFSVTILDEEKYLTVTVCLCAPCEAKLSSIQWMQEDLEVTNKETNKQTSWLYALK
jgi:hypothetical protein